MSPDEVFAYAMDVVEISEGGLSMDAGDRGNWTGGIVNMGELRGSNFGISAAAYPDLDIANLTWEDAKAIYWRDYWTPLHLELFPPALAVVALDAAINHGVGRVLDWMREQPQSFVTLSARRLEHYASLSTWGTYGKGWSLRVARVLRAAQKLAA